MCHPGIRFADIRDLVMTRIKGSVRTEIPARVRSTHLAGMTQERVGRTPASAAHRDVIIDAHALHKEKLAGRAVAAMNMMGGFGSSGTTLARHQMMFCARGSGLHDKLAFQANKAVGDFRVIMPWHRLTRIQRENRDL